MRILVLCALAMTLSTTSARSQSLKPEAPAPLQPGINKGVADNTVGTHYWYFKGGPGKTHVIAQFKPGGVMGNPYNCGITITLSDQGHTWHTTKVLSSDSKQVECVFDGDLKAPTKVLVTVFPPQPGLLRLGGEYQLECSGAVAFGEKSNLDPIIAVYKQMNGYTKNFGASKFLADGTIQTETGEGGNWKLFDQDSKMYVINIDGQERRSLQFVAGRGLCDGDSIVFQLLK